MKRTDFISGRWKPVVTCAETHPEHGSRCVHPLEHTGRHRDVRNRVWNCKCVPGKPCARHGGPS
jgi:hypothetical protein